MSTVWFVLQKPFASLWWDMEVGSWARLCTKLFGFNEAEINGDEYHQLLRDPKTYGGAGKRSNTLDGTMYGLLDETKRFIPEPILSYRVASVALSCMRYLHHQDSNNPPMQDNLLAAWATKSKRLPWLWRQRMRVTLIGCRRPTSLPQSLRRSHQMLYSKGIQSHNFYQQRHIFYIWTLDLLYHTLCKAMKSDVLTKALSKPFIPSVACILFPRRIKRVQKAVSAYLEKVSQSICSDLRMPTNMLIVRSVEFRCLRSEAGCALQHNVSSTT